MFITHRLLIKTFGKKKGMSIYRKIDKNGFLKVYRIPNEERGQFSGAWIVKAWDSEEIKKYIPELKKEIERIEIQRKKNEK